MTKCKCNNCDCNVIDRQKVDSTKLTMLGEDVLLGMAEFYKALADNTRLKIINVLAREELCVCDICSLLNMTKSAISHQLQYLKQLHLIKSRKSGKHILYSLEDEHVAKVFVICEEHVMEALNEKN